MQMPKIVVSLFDKKTKQEFLSNDKSYLGNTTKLNNCQEGDIVILQDIESKEIFGLAYIDVFPDGKIYAEHHPLEIDVYSGTAAKYNRYEIKIKNFRNVNISFEDMAIICGKSVDDKVRNNIWKGSCFGFRSANYNGEDSENVLRRLNIFVRSILESR